MKRGSRQNDYTYSLISNKGLYANEVYLENLETIITAVELLQRHFDLSLQHDLLQLVTVKPRTLQELCKLTNRNRVEVQPMVCWLIYTGVCKTDLLGSSINERSIIRYTLSEHP